jgi:hypothetical protein
MSGLSNYLENKLLDHTLRNTSYTPVTTVYLALYVGSPTDTGSGGTEVAVTRQAATFGAAASGTVSNSSSISFTSMPVATVTHIGIFDASTGGNLLIHGALSASVVSASGDTFTIAANDLDVTLD